MALQSKGTSRALAAPGRAARKLDILDRFPADDGVPMENLHHRNNYPYLQNSLERWLGAQGRTAFIAGNNFVYYDIDDPNHNVGPDMYVILDVPRKRERDCWRAFMEGGRYPDLVLEMVSKNSGHKDWVTNKAIYQDLLRVPNYAVYDDRPLKRPRHPLLSCFRLVAGVYEEVPVTPEGRVFCDVVGLYLGMHDEWLRWFDPTGQLVLTDAEENGRRAEENARRAEENARRAEENARRAEENARRAEENAHRADALQAEVERLRRLQR